VRRVGFAESLVEIFDLPNLSEDDYSDCYSDDADFFDLDMVDLPQKIRRGDEEDYEETLSRLQHLLPNVI
jgi:hypothetical protein